jgi:predicted RNase H-like HicB family nuclease
MAEKRSLPTEFREEAEKFAAFPFVVSLVKDVDEEGQPVFLAINPELDGCMADGKSFEEAIENLNDARTDYIQVLLLSGQPIPLPSVMVEGQEQEIESIPVLTYDASEGEAKPVPVQSDEKNIVAEYAFTLLPAVG